MLTHAIAREPISPDPLVIREQQLVTKVLQLYREGNNLEVILTLIEQLREVRRQLRERPQPAPQRRVN